MSPQSRLSPHTGSKPSGLFQMSVCSPGCSSCHPLPPASCVPRSFSLPHSGPLLCSSHVLPCHGTVPTTVPFSLFLTATDTTCTYLVNGALTGTPPVTRLRAEAPLLFIHQPKSLFACRDSHSLNLWPAPQRYSGVCDREPWGYLYMGQRGPRTASATFCHYLLQMRKQAQGD